MFAMSSDDETTAAEGGHRANGATAVQDSSIDDVTKEDDVTDGDVTDDTAVAGGSGANHYAGSETTDKDSSKDDVMESDDVTDDDVRAENGGGVWEGTPLKDMPRVGGSAPPQYPPLNPSK
jgi:hypothetical protein